MRISIVRRDHPFSHVPSASCLLPRTCWTVQAFPARIVLQNREKHASRETIEIACNIQGPVREFTVQQDLERGAVFISAIAANGRFRFRIEACKEAIELRAVEAPPSGIVANGKTLYKNDCLSWKTAGLFYEKRLPERLSLGCHRLQEWDKVWRRFDPVEIFPVLFHLSLWVPPEANTPSAMSHLLEKGFEPFLKAAFFSVLCPHLEDDQYQGLLEHTTAVDPQAAPCFLIANAGRRIRALFIQQSGYEISLLPQSQFHAGRMTDVQLDGIGTIDFEWSKHLLRRAIVRAVNDCRVHLKLPKPIGSYRIRDSISDIGNRNSVETDLCLEAGKVYFLDRFQK